VDIALLKNTRVREGVNVRFRAEFFNILNHANLQHATRDHGCHGADGWCPAVIRCGAKRVFNSRRDYGNLDNLASGSAGG
jgi:hypothetical protein